MCSEAVDLAIRQLVADGHEVKGFLPQSYWRDAPPNDKIHALVKEGLVTVVPYGKNDDIVIIEYAVKNGFTIISNDMFGKEVELIKGDQLGESEKEREGMMIVIKSTLRFNFCAGYFVLHTIGKMLYQLKL